ncbi:MAG: acetyl-CoA carboxylase biotin carboxylase subunit [Niabella sp.]
MIKRILIANRGEIALRIQRTAKEMGIATVAIYSIADKNAAYVKAADTSVPLTGELLSETYLNIGQVIVAAQQTNADAIHPGYGFLSENAAFAEACKNAGIVFIGPDASAMYTMGNKITARNAAVKAGIPVTPGLTGSLEALLANHDRAGFPLLIKAAAGGGGKGMRVVHNERELKVDLEATAREAQTYFGDDTIYIEKYIEKPRHIEVQILGDQHGNIIHLFERECSLQRRHQKIIEEAPSPTLQPDLRKKICEAAVALAKSINYYSAGTLEFLLDENMSFYFLEMNTRIQVEHPVTELTTGIDIVREQINIANGGQLPFSQEDIQQKGHAIECRIYAEDPEENFLPAPGSILYYAEPVTEITDTRIRIDSMQLKSGDFISGDFDPMISKLITWGSSREAARLAMLAALRHYHIKGIKNNIHFLATLLQHPDFMNNQFSTNYIGQHLNMILEERSAEKQRSGYLVPVAAGIVKSLSANKPPQDIWQTIGYWRQSRQLPVIIDNRKIIVELSGRHNNKVVFISEGIKYATALEHTKGLSYLLSVNDITCPVSIYEIKPGLYEIDYAGYQYHFIRPDISYVDHEIFSRESSSKNDPSNIVSPMPGKVVKMSVRPGDTIEKGSLLLIVEAMKMENNIISPAKATVEEVLVNEGDKVNVNMKLVKLKAITD